MQCPQCQQENRGGAKFCDACATSLPQSCPSCGTENRPGARFCNECATPLGTPPASRATPPGAPRLTQVEPTPAAKPYPPPRTYTPPHLTEKILTSRSALEGERKQVTVLFADIKDSTELIKDLDPEDAQKLLDPAIHIMMEAVHRFEGTVNQVLGDGIMALFGAPIAHEDHALRACYASLAMQSAMRAYTDEVRNTHGIPLQIRVGLNAGEVVVRAIGNDLHMDYSAVGQTTHLAARMEQLATPGTIVLTAATLRLVEGRVRVTTLGPVPVKGMREPVEVFELVGASAIKRRLQAAVARGLTKFVGRDPELTALMHALDQAASGQGQIVAAVGEAGVGKSRLVYECLQSPRMRGWRVLESASVSYGKATPYFPVIDLLKRYVQIDDGDDARTVRAKVTGHLLTLDETLQETIAPLLSLLDVLPQDNPFLQLDPPQRRRQTLAALKRIVLRESQVQPLLVVFEDLHWIDSETQVLLDSLVESLPTTELLLLVNYRPEYQHSWGSKTYYTQLRLDPLTPESAETFLQSMMGDDASLKPLKKLLIERTEGNPLFLEESVRTLVETGMLVGEAGAYRVVQELPAMAVPPTVQAILAARIDRLPAEEKQLLQTAAVIGTEVALPLLQAIADLPEEALQRGLAHLQTAEFLYETNLYPEREYTFKHALTHEVAYGSLLQERRRVLHAQIVEALETPVDDPLADQAERLAHHAFRGKVWDKALPYARQAGTKAMARSANQEAVSWFEQALVALQHLPENHDTMVQGIDIRFDLRNALLVLGEYQQILDCLREAQSLAGAINDRHRLGRLLSYMAQYTNQMGDYERAIAYCQQVLALAAGPEDMALRIGALLHLGSAYTRSGDYRRAMDFLRQNVTALEGELRYERFGRMGLPAVMSRFYLVLCLSETGAFAEGLTWGNEAIRMAEAIDRPFDRLNAYLSVGQLHLYRGDVAEATARFEQSLSLSQETDFRLHYPIAAAYLAAAYAQCGRTDEVVPLVKQAGDSFLYPRYNLFCGDAYLGAGDVEAAGQLVLNTLERIRNRQERGHEAWALHLLGDIAMHHDPPDVESAKTHYQQALALANELGMRPLQAHCHRGLGTLYSQIGRTEQARAELSTAIDMYRDMAMTFWLPETEAALADVGKR